MKTFLVVVLIFAVLMVPVIMIVRHFANDETQKLQKALREEQQAWSRMRRVMESDIQHMRENGLVGNKNEKQHQ